MTTRTHYHVIESTPGYLPDDDSPFATYSRAEANGAAVELARQLREEGYRVYGSAKSGRYDAECSDHIYDLGRVIEIIPCAESDCAPEDES